METISAMLGVSSRIKLAMTGHMLGESYQSYGSGGSESTSIDNLILDIRIDASGLHIHIVGTAGSTNISMSAVISWELLILRFPYFTRLMNLSEVHPVQ